MPCSGGGGGGGSASNGGSEAPEDEVKPLAGSREGGGGGWGGIQGVGRGCRESHEEWLGKLAGEEGRWGGVCWPFLWVLCPSVAWAIDAPEGPANATDKQLQGVAVPSCELLQASGAGGGNGHGPRLRLHQ